MFKGALAVALLVPVICGPGPSHAQTPQTSGQHQQLPPPPEQRVDINHASVEELMKVPGMTRTWAERIVRFRPYRSKQDLADSGVVPAAVYNRIKDYVIAHQDKK